MEDGQLRDIEEGVEEKGKNKPQVPTVVTQHLEQEQEEHSEPIEELPLSTGLFGHLRDLGKFPC